MSKDTEEIKKGHYKKALEKLASIEIESAEKGYLLRSLEDVVKFSKAALGWEPEGDGRKWVAPTEKLLDKINLKFGSHLSCIVSNDPRQPKDMQPAVLLNIYERPGRGKYIAAVSAGGEEAIGGFTYCLVKIPQDWEVE